jgi:PTH2 family peptidyl-tRNA hydrolase
MNSENAMNIKQIIVIRRDLKMRRGKEIAQGAHASMAALLHGIDLLADGSARLPLWPEARQWLEGSFTKVTVKVTSEEELLAVRDRAEAAGIPHALIQDAGRTEFHGVPTYTALAVGPASAERLAPVTGDLSLY